jgi:GNAT superfamily N-acetyltransferase
MSLEHAGCVVSTDAGLLDVDFICAALAGSYWARDRPRHVVEQSIRNSLCFGLYEKQGGRQVGFARVVTDGATFSWLCDVVIDGSRRGMGLGKFLMSFVVAHPQVGGTVCLLGTRDAHGLYEKFGFARSEQMRRPPSPGRPGPPCQA